MGLFMAMSGVIGSNPEEVRESIADFVQSGKLTDQLSKKDKGAILGSSNGVAVLYPES